MKNLIQRNGPRAARPMRLAVSMAALTIGVASAIGAMAGQAHAAQPVKAKLKHGVLTIRGSKAADEIALRLKAGDPAVVQVDVGDDGSANFDFARTNIVEIVVDGKAGDDLTRIDESNGVFTDGIPTTLRGGDGNDNLAGGSGVERLDGGDGNDSIDGNRGNDPAHMGAGDDTFVWDPGDGSDVVEGQNGTDTMIFNGAGIADQIDLTANGNRLTFFRNPGNVTMDTAGVERVDFNALGGADVVTVNDLTGTGVSDLNVDLASTLGGTNGDGAIDRIVLNGTNGDDTIKVAGDAAGVKVSGLATTVGILHAEGASDRLEINTLTGNDTVDSSGLADGVIQLFVDGVFVP